MSCANRRQKCTRSPGRAHGVPVISGHGRLTVHGACARVDPDDDQPPGCVVPALDSSTPASWRGFEGVAFSGPYGQIGRLPCLIRKVKRFTLSPDLRICGFAKPRESNSKETSSGRLTWQEITATMGAHSNTGDADMATTNQFGIFARNINGGINTGTDAVRGFSDAKCRRVYRACAAVLPAEEVTFVRKTFNAAQTVSLTGCTVAQAWVSRMLSSVETEFSTQTTIRGADNDEVIHDSRTARQMLLKVLAA